MSDLERGPEPEPKSGWSDVASLQMRPKSDSGPVKFRPGVWVALWVFVSAVLVAWLSAKRNGHPDTAEQIGYLFGSFLGVWLYAYVLGWMVFRVAGRSLLAGRITVCAIALLILTGNLMHELRYSNDKTRAEQAALAKDLRGDIATLAKGTEGYEPIAALDQNATVGGESGEIQVFLKSYFNKVITQHNEYLAELDANGWNRLLDAKRLEQDGGMAESQAIVTRSQATVEKFRQRWKTTFDDTLRSAEAMDTSEPMKRGFVAGFRDSSGKANIQATQIWDLEAGIVAAGGDAIELLAAHRGQWAAESDQLVFSDQQTLDAYNAILARVDALVQREEDLRSASRDKALRSLQEVENQ